MIKVFSTGRAPLLLLLPGAFARTWPKIDGTVIGVDVAVPFVFLLGNIWTSVSNAGCLPLLLSGAIAGALLATAGAAIVAADDDDVFAFLFSNSWTRNSSQGRPTLLLSGAIAGALLATAGAAIVAADDDDVFAFLFSNSWTRNSSKGRKTLPLLGAIAGTLLMTADGAAIGADVFGFIFGNFGLFFCNFCTSFSSTGRASVLLLGEDGAAIGPDPFPICNKAPIKGRDGATGRIAGVGVGAPASLEGALLKGGTGLISCDASWLKCS
jgi:hypothetical protein